MQKVTARHDCIKTESLFFHEPHPSQPAANKFHSSELNKWHSQQQQQSKSMNNYTFYAHTLHMENKIGRIIGTIANK